MQETFFVFGAWEFGDDRVWGGCEYRVFDHAVSFLLSSKFNRSVVLNLAV